MMQANPNNDTQTVLLHSQEQYAAVAIKKAENKRFFLQQPYLEKGEGTAHLLVSIVNAQWSTSYSILDPFFLNRRTRQCCPLSPFLFALPVEPLEEAIHSCTDIVGFRRSTGEEKIALYGDDTLVFLRDTNIYLSIVISLIDTYGIVSGFNINWDIATGK